LLQAILNSILSSCGPAPGNTSRGKVFMLSESRCSCCRCVSTRCVGLPRSNPALQRGPALRHGRDPEA
jgi:hypothetical protein